MTSLSKLRYHATLELLRPLPLRPAIGALDAMSSVSHLLHPQQRRLAAAWLAQVLPEADPRRERIPDLVRTMFRVAMFRRHLSDLICRHHWRDHRGLLHVDGIERLERALERGKGAVLVSSHIGMPRLLRWYLRGCPRFRVLYLLRIGFPPQDTRSFRGRLQVWYRRRFRLDDDSLTGDESFHAQYMHKAYRHLRSNGVVNIAGDGSRGSQDGVPVWIAGREHRFATGCAALALMSGAAILPCFAWLDSARSFRLEIEDELPLDRGADPATERERAVRLYAARVSEFIRMHPENTVRKDYSLALAA